MQILSKPPQWERTVGDIAIQVMWKGVQLNDNSWIKPAVYTTVWCWAVLWQPVTLIMHIFFVLFSYKLGRLRTPNVFLNLLQAFAAFSELRFTICPRLPRWHGGKRRPGHGWRNMGLPSLLSLMLVRATSGSFHTWELEHFQHQSMDWKYSSACRHCEKGNTRGRVCVLRKSESPESPSDWRFEWSWDPQAGCCFAFLTHSWENADTNQVCARQCC